MAAQNDDPWLVLGLESGTDIEKTKSQWKRLAAENQFIGTLPYLSCFSRETGTHLPSMLSQSSIRFCLRLEAGKNPLLVLPASSSQTFRCLSSLDLDLVDCSSAVN